jgi:Fe2+ or Zn2+ uptake regulation protein
MMLLKQEAAQPDRPAGENLKRDWLVHAVASDRLVRVYRCLKELTRHGAARLIDLQGAPPHYESSKRPHHHFFCCEQCSRLSI